MWNSFVEPVGAYLRERFRARIGLLVLLLLAASCLSLFPAGLVDITMRAVLAGLLVFQFRLWDDLQDLARDRREHPERVLVNTRNQLPFFVLLAGVSLGSLLWLTVSRSWLQVIVYGGLCAGLGLWYQIFRPWSSNASANSIIVLLKYPAFIVLLAPWMPGDSHRARFWLTILMLYIVLVVYEWRYDQRRGSLKGEGPA